jgi:mannose-6-phosphate isomerase-like protein (cupin superfamily)
MAGDVILSSGNQLRAMIKESSPPVPQFHKLRAQLPSKGATDIPYAATDRLWVVLKTYASGGENELHAHPNEDHIFLIMQGRAEFYGPNEETRILGHNEFVLLPRGTYYYFKSIDSQPLVMLRIGAIVDPTDDPIYRVNIEGNEMDGFSKENKSVPYELSDDWFE